MDGMENMEKLSRDQLIEKVNILSSQLAKLEKLQPKCLRLETALQSTESKFKSVFEDSPVGKSLTEIDGTLKINQAFADMLGYSIEELKLKHWKAITHPDDIQKSEDFVQLLLDGKKSMAKYEKRYLHKAGHIVWTVVTTALKKDANKQPEFFLTTINDISDWKKAEKDLSEKTAFLNKIIESSAVSTWISDANGTAIQTNTACLKFFGASADEVIGKYNLFNDEVLDKQGLMPDIRRVFEKGEVANVVFDYNFSEVKHVNVKTPTHKIINEIFTPVIDNNGIVTNVICQAIDLTEIKLAEKRFQETSTLLSEILNTIPIRVFWKDLESNYLGCNLPFAQDAGLENPANVIGKTDYDMFVREHAEKFRADDKLVIESGIPKLGFEEPQENLNDFDHWLRTNKVPLTDHSGNITGVLGTYEDISDRKQAEEELKKYRDKLEELVKQRTTELETKNKELNNAMKVFVGREITITQLQNRIRALEGK